ncbi:Rv1733c family protein [Streptomyces antibioticus]|uniref:Rv1733c family protein n=1 Tax=Streptomyces antibioticus TaxID=1890 RepID=UPI0033A9D2A0
MRIRMRDRRWRRNPLRRRSDVVEAWTALVVGVLLLVAAPLAGAVAGRWVHDEARAAAAEQRAERHRVSAEVVGGVPEALPTADGAREQMFRVDVRWAPPGEPARTTTARVPAGTRQGDRVDVWFDDKGRSVPPPADGTAVWQQTLTMGLAATGGAVAVVLLGHGVVRRVAMRHRLAEWDREWTRTEPEWTRRRPA